MACGVWRVAHALFNRLAPPLPARDHAHDGTTLFDDIARRLADRVVDSTIYDCYSTTTASTTPLVLRHSYCYVIGTPRDRGQVTNKRRLPLP